MHIQVDRDSDAETERERERRQRKRLYLIEKQCSCFGALGGGSLLGDAHLLQQRPAHLQDLPLQRVHGHGLVVRDLLRGRASGYDQFRVYRVLARKVRKRRRCKRQFLIATALQTKALNSKPHVAAARPSGEVLVVKKLDTFRMGFVQDINPENNNKTT